MDMQTRIAELEYLLRQSTQCLQSIMYCPEQVRNLTDEGYFTPQWLVGQIKENERALSADREENNP